MGRVPRAGRYALAGAYAAFVLYSSVVEPPGGGFPPGGPLGIGVDKWAHLVTYGILAVLLAFAVLARTSRALAFVVTIAAAYGAGIEVVQAFLPMRAFDFADAAANTVGAALGTGVWHAAARHSAVASVNAEREQGDEP